MRRATTELVENLLKAYGPFPEVIVDLGGCESSDQFRHLFRYKVWDIRDKPDVDKVVDARNMVTSGTVEQGSVGTLMSFDAFEHIYEIREVAEQINLVVRQNGLVIVGVPFAFPYHDPSGDYWRFSAQSLEKMFETGFNKIESGYYDETITTTWGNMLMASYYIGRKKS